MSDVNLTLEERLEIMERTMDVLRERMLQDDAAVNTALKASRRGALRLKICETAAKRAA